MKKKKQSTDWEKIFVNYISTKKTGIQNNKQHLKLNHKKTNYSIYKWAKHLKKCLAKKYTEMAK